ncbi:hypothetical protein Tco_1078431 [Tanacetum coccineum]|uniref:Remorin C-terminal domain-containing protein n=1 Tax=Tanacetum coccineum TaxID=301880 RepID=A0ABQ5HNZ3_9ASTR
MKRASKGYTRENIPMFPIMIVQGLVVQGEGLTHPPRSPTQSPVADEAAYTGVNARYGGATTTVTGLEAGEGCGNIDKTPTTPHDSPFIRVNTLGSDEGSMTLQELMLIKKVKKLDNKVKSSQARRRAKIIVSDDEDDLEDPSKQGRKIAEIDQDPAISLVQHDAEIQGRHKHDMEFGFDFDTAKDVSTAKPVSTAGAAVTKPVSTAGAAVTTASIAAVSTASIATVSTASPTKRVSTADDITIAETLVYTRKSASKDKAAVRLQAKLEEKERQMIARIHEAASSFNVEEWEDIQARVEADEELAQRLQAKEMKIYTKAKQARMLVEFINQRKRCFATQRAEERRNKLPT